MLKSAFLILFILTAGIVGYLIPKINVQNTADFLGKKSPDTLQVNSSDCIPTFADGGGPYYKPNSPFREKIVPEVNNGEKLIVSGKILNNDCTTLVPNATLDLWQANESGDYEVEWYRGQVKTDKLGNYKFETVVPRGYGEGTGYRPPHIHFKVFIEGKEIITSQIFLPVVRGTTGFNDAYIMKIKSLKLFRAPIHFGTHNIILP